jgi:hypothetical protein
VYVSEAHACEVRIADWGELMSLPERRGDSTISLVKGLYWAHWLFVVGLGWLPLRAVRLLVVGVRQRNWMLFGADSLHYHVFRGSNSVAGIS